MQNSESQFLPLGRHLAASLSEFHAREIQDMCLTLHNVDDLEWISFYYDWFLHRCQLLPISQEDRQQFPIHRLFSISGYTMSRRPGFSILGRCRAYPSGQHAMITMERLWPSDRIAQPAPTLVKQAAKQLKAIQELREKYSDRQLYHADMIQSIIHYCSERGLSCLNWAIQGQLALKRMEMGQSFTWDLVKPGTTEYYQLTIDVDAAFVP